MRFLLVLGVIVLQILSSKERCVQNVVIFLATTVLITHSFMIHSTHQYIVCHVLQFLVYLLPEGAQHRLYHSCSAQHNPLHCLLWHVEVQLGKHLPVHRKKKQIGKQQHTDVSN